jgi:hypothetical protein
VLAALAEAAPRAVIAYLSRRGRVVQWLCDALHLDVVATFIGA